MTADDKYFLFNRDNLMQLIQIQLSHKEKTISQSFWEYLKSASNFDQFGTKDDPLTWCISEIKDSKSCG